MPLDPDDKRLTYLPETDILKAAGHVFAYHGYWWCAHPERGLILHRRYSPQASRQRTIALDLCEKLYPWADVRYHELVLVRDDPGRY